MGLGVYPNILHNYLYYVAMFCGFLYVCANPFIYAIKFDPVRRILKGLILCKNEMEPPGISIEMNQNTTRNRAV